MNTIAIIQARMGSTRLPGKVLMDIGGRSMLERVVMRTRSAQFVDGVVVATTTDPGDDVIVDLCRATGTSCFRGSEDDVLDRYYHAASACDADHIVRITSDCPLIDPSIIDRVIGGFLDARPDYASNFIDRTYPRGLDTEVFSRSALNRTWREATDKASRVHVTPYLYLHPDRFTVLSITGDAPSSDLRWTVDTELDLEVIREIYHEGGNPVDLKWKFALALVRADPDRLARNGAVQQKAMEDG